MGVNGTTTGVFEDELQRDTLFAWRARASNGTITSDWSETFTFRTIEVGNASGKGACCPPPNRLDIVLAVVDATGNLFRNNTQQFTERVAECLAVTDGDWGRRLNDSGVIGKDTVGYRVPGTSNPYSIDILLGATSNNPIPHWDGHGQVGGSWFAVNGSNCVLGAVTAR